MITAPLGPPMLVIPRDSQISNSHSFRRGFAGRVAHACDIVAVISSIHQIRSHDYHLQGNSGARVLCAAAIAFFVGQWAERIGGCVRELRRREIALMESADRHPGAVAGFCSKRESSLTRRSL
jgi:hypothetical protein